MKIKIGIIDYDNKVVEVVYDNVRGVEFKVVEDSEIYSQGFDTTDQNKQYLTVKFEDGSSSTLRLSSCRSFEITNED